RCTRPVVRLRKYFASIRPANPPWFSIPRTFLRKRWPLTPGAFSLSGLLPTAKFIESQLPARSPFSSIPKQNTSGTSPFHPTELSMSPPVTRVRSSPSPLTPKASSSTPAPEPPLYVSAISQTQRPAPPPPTVLSPPQGTTTFTTGPVVNPGQAQPQQPFVPFPPIVSTSIYRISNEGAPEELWTSREDVVYSLGLASDGRLLAGTGNNGALLAIDGHGVFAHLAT